MSTTFDNATHTNAVLSIAEFNDLVFGSNALWTGANTIVSLAGSNKFRCAGQVYADATAVTGLGTNIRVEVLGSGAIASSTSAAISLTGSSAVTNAGYLTGVWAVLFSSAGNSVVNTGTMVGDVNAVAFGFGTQEDRIVNSGTIVSTGNAAIEFETSGRGTVINSGLISAELRTAILSIGTGAVTVSNTGTISGYQALSTGIGDDTVTNAGTIAGLAFLNSGDDVYDGSAGINDGIIDGGSGDDTLIGGSAGDRLFGSDGDDLLVGNGGNDTLSGGLGGDEFDGGAGRDAVDYTDQFGVLADLANPAANTAAASGDIYIGIENLIGSFAADSLFGDDSRNVLRGSEGDDFLDGRRGADRMVGGGGDDIFVVDDARDRTVEVDSSGVDTARTTVSFACQESIENLVLLGTAGIDGTGNTQANVITGNSGANVLNGKFANDSLTGGGGADTFRFDSALDPDNNVDRLNDFLAGTDKISLSRAIFTELNSGVTLQANRFVVGGAALDANDRIIFNTTTGVLSYDADGNGAGAQIAFAQIGVGVPLAASDFVLTG